MNSKNREWILYEIYFYQNSFYMKIFQFTFVLSVNKRCEANDF
ncbi:hypothetical protein SAMN05216584_11256 [Selenomonas sp. WCT3]|nr:hypothetical protein SAMN05216584_11256 [Selenomonas ruminantium]